MSGDNQNKTLCSRICSHKYTINSKVPEELNNPLIQTNGESGLGENINIQWEWEKKKADCKMKKRIKYHFHDHVYKLINRPDVQRRFPWKLILHLVLVALVTTQVYFHASEKFKITGFLIKANDDLRHYFTDTEGSVSCDGEVKLYTIDDVYNQIQIIVENYYSAPYQAVALSSLYHADSRDDTRVPKTLNMSIEYLEVEKCKSNLDTSTFPNTSKSFTINRELFQITNDTDDADNESVNETCDDYNSTCCSRNNCNHSIHDQVEYFINIKNLYRIKHVKFLMDLPIQTYQKGVIEDANAVSVDFNATVTLNTHDYLHTSHVTFETTVEAKFQRHPQCKATKTKNIIISCFVIVFSVFVLIAYSLSVKRAVWLAKDVKFHFLVYYKKKLRWQEIHILFNKFYIVMLFTCVLLVITTILEIISDHLDCIFLNLIEVVSILLGIGVFLLWCGFFAFLKYFETLNVLLITIQLAIPSVLRFAVCMLILFLAFMFCGCLIFGHYNPQFEDPLVASETLIKIIYGDGLADAFAATSVTSSANLILLPIFGKIYLILFLFIFIYMVLSLFIGIFDHAYDSLSNNWRNRSRGFLLDWVEGEPDNDLRKNYPFPVPRIRDLPSEFRTECCSLHSHSVPSAEEMSQYAATNTEDAVSHDAIPLPSFAATNVTDSSSHTNIDEGAKSKKRKLAHFSSDSKLQTSHHTKPTHHENLSQSLNISREYYHTSQSRSKLLYGSVVKSIVQEPPDASEQEVARARAQFKLFNRGQEFEMNEVQNFDA